MTPGRGMALALALARRGLGRTGGNPAVGCIVMQGERVIGRGRTHDGGRPHAETRALADAAARYGADAARGATVFVTLEPCAHHGRTPPCADALIAAGVARVIAPLPDPDPRVAGKGFAMLRAAGIEVLVGPGEAEARALLAPYLRLRENGRPTVTLKLAATLDGRIATRTGESQWITGPRARARGHLLRARSDAILTGIGTVLADDPGLDVRLPGLSDASPVPVVADRALRTPPGARVLRRGTAVIAGDARRHPERADALRATGAQVMQVDADGGIDTLLAALGERGYASVFCEGGATLAAALVRADRVDRLVWVTAGTLLGGDARGALDALGLDRLAAAPDFRPLSSEAVGPDIWHVGARATA